MKKPLSMFVLASLFVTATAWAQPPGEARKDHPRGHYLLHERVAEKLELTEEQRESIRQLVQDKRAEKTHDRGAWKKHKKAYGALLDAPSFDEHAARELLAEKTERQLTHLKFQHQLRQILTEEQRQQLDKRHQRMMSKHHSKHRSSKHHSPKRHSRYKPH